jgi:hypothetical protein
MLFTRFNLFCLFQTLKVKIMKTGNFWISSLCPLEFLLTELATFKGTFQLKQREVAIHFFDGTVWRNVIFNTLQHFVELLYDKHVASVHFGPIYPTLQHEHAKLTRPEEQKAVKQNVMTVHCEFMFDIDIDSYPTRGQVCKCPKQSICDVCWTTFMYPAVRYLKTVFTEVFGWTRFFFVFSGRRGMHVWVVEPEVIQWTHTQRARCFKNVFINPSIRERYFQGKADCFPRFDEDVTTQFGHNHKVPLGLHGETHNFCSVMEKPLEFLPSRDIVHYSHLTPEIVRRSVDEIKKHL